MKKLLYFSHGLSANGIETFLFNILGKLDKSKYDVTVIIAIDEGVSQLHEKEVLDMGVKVIHAGDLDSLKKKIAYVKRIKKLLKDGNYDIVHSNMDLLNGITLTFAKRYKVKKRICHAHTSKSQYRPIGYSAKLRNFAQKCYYSFMKHRIIKSSTTLLACSDVAGEYFYGTHDYKLIYNGIDFASFAAPENFDAAEYLRCINCVDNKKHHIVSVGRLTQAKNPLFALEIISELKKIRDDFQYILVGTGELEEQTKQRAKELKIDDTVIFTGVRTDIPRILNCCDLFLMPSLFEGLPFSLIEAQAAGLKCIVSDVVTETADIGTVKFFSLDKSAESWAMFINAELDTPTPAVDSKKAELFDVSNTVRQLENIYDN